MILMNCDAGQRQVRWSKDFVDCCAYAIQYGILPHHQRWNLECLGFPYVCMLTMFDTKVWKGIAFPELHTAAGQLMAELAKKGFLPEAR